MADDALRKIADERVGSVLRGKYRLDRVLGVGGMATVYAATHRNSKRFAVKVLHTEISMHDATRARFLREGYVANQVKHPGAVAVLDEDVAEDGSAFLVMELLEGRSLDELWHENGRRLPLPLVVALGDAVLDVLVAAHARGIVHRDIKPANLFLTDQGELKVLDFGIARLRDDSVTHTTAPGSILGTPAFMAPEQLTGKSADVDAKTDLWAFAATLFSLLAGTLVHEGENALQFIADAATRPARSLGSVAKEVPKPIIDVIDRGLRTEKSERWENAAAMREALVDAWAQVAGAPVARLPTRSAASSSDAPGSATPVSGGGLSDPSAFIPTMPASSGAARRAPMFTTGAAVAKARSEPPLVRTRARRLMSRPVALGALACVLVGGGTLAGAAAYRARRAPRVRFCAFLDATADGPRCALEIDAAAVAARGADTSYRVTEIGGRVVAVEHVTFGGPEIIVSWADDQTVSTEVVRGEGGSIREVIDRNHYGVVEEREKWSDGGRLVDLVEEDDATPRRRFHDSGGDPLTEITSIHRQFDANGRITREQYFAAAGRPAADQIGAYGYEYVFGRTIGTAIRTTILGADGKPAARKSGAAVTVVADDGTPGGADVRYFDREEKAATVDGVHREHRVWTPAHSLSAVSWFGLQDEPVTNLDIGAHETRSQWDAAKRTRTRTFYDETGHRHPAKAPEGSGDRNTYDERGRMVLNETLDNEGNRTYRAKLSAVDRFTWDDDDNMTLIERLDVTGALMQGHGWAKQATPRVEHGRPVEIRQYDENGKLAPSLSNGAITRFTFDARGLMVSMAGYGADERPSPNGDGWSTMLVRYDRLGNRVEVSFLGPDGQPCMTTEGFAIARVSYDDDGAWTGTSYFDSAGSPTMYDGGFATVTVALDALGRPIRTEYLDTHGERVLQRAGYASVRSSRDRNGDVVELSTFGRRDEPVVRDEGYATKRTTYDLRRRPTEIALFDVSGMPSPGAGGWTIERKMYDGRGLLVREDHLDASRRPVLTKSGGASIAKAYDARGNVIEEATLGLDGAPIAASSGYATKRTTYDERDQLASEALLGPDGRPAAGKDGWSLRRLRHDDHGNLVEEAFFDGEHRPIAPKGAAYTSVTSVFDERLRLVETAYFDGAGAPSVGPDGVAAVRYERDALGHATETAYVDGLGSPAASRDGKIVVRASYDDAGHVIEERFVDGAGSPRVARDGCAGHRTKYDRLGRKVEESCDDTKGGLALSVDGWATRRTLRDARGNAVDESTYAPDGSLRGDKDGVARRKSRFDDRNLLQETTYFDENDKPTHDKHGAQAVRFTYDERGKEISETATDERGRSVVPAAK